MRSFVRYAAVVLAVSLAIASAGRTPADSVHVTATVPELTIGSLQCSPQPYDPTVGPLTTSFTLSRPCSVVVTFSDSLGATKRVITLADAPAGPVMVTWDGRDSAGALVQASWYLCTVSTSVAGTSMQASLAHDVMVSYGPPLIMEAKGVSPRPFSPPGDTVISARLSRDAMVSVTIKTSAGKVIRNEPTRMWFAGTCTYRWDGRDNGGKIAADGTYYCTFSGADSGGNTASVTQTVIKKKASKR